ncbi:MraY family glycosyltransferase [Algoriphagus litoralis]|uniref:MraY family glycosyltransferase n=1 Tax=Algoriphagus litoralis TaxID=2202829 RepID=UPI000DBA6C45|nr:glycosyltransferase family 4 protein [Algoriphagus litoralis]
MILSSLIVFLVLLLIGLIYHRLAMKFGIVDKPNHRSSHTFSTVRGGGILFPLAVIFWWLIFDFQHTWMVLGLIWVSAISMLDDMYTLSRKLRFGVQFLALSMAFYDLGVFEQINIFALPVLYFISLGIINAINFMDGINGISGLYFLVFFGTMLAIQVYLPVFEDSLIRYIILSILAFLFFNLRKKALMFAGDIGSISLAYLTIYFLLNWYLIEQNWTIILILGVYGVEVSVTMVERLLRKENLLQPHRTHLYQLIVNELKVNHVTLAIIYAIAQAAINLFLFIIPQKAPGALTASLVLVSLLLIYLAIKIPLRKKIRI